MDSLDNSVAILMPKLGTDYERFAIRYGGLSQQLAKLSVGHFFAESHTSYDPVRDTFQGAFDVARTDFVAQQPVPRVVRDLTMALDAKPLYSAPGKRLVHDPRTNLFIADKTNLVRSAPAIHPVTRFATAATLQEALDTVPGDRIVIKPARGMLSKGVRIVTKSQAATDPFEPGDFMVSEFIDTAAGIPELGIEGVHNLRIISVGAAVIGSIARVGGNGGNILRNDEYGVFVGPDDIPDSMHSIADAVHDVLATQPGNGKNVIAIDIMRGHNAAGELVDILCEVNRRPLRVSLYDLPSSERNTDSPVRTLATKWDRAEAEMLRTIVSAEVA